MSDEDKNKNPKKNKKPKKGWLGWLKELLILVVLVIVVGWGTDLWRSQSMVSGQAPPLVATSIQNNSIDLITMSQEKPVMVYFWATWCAVCSSVSPSVDFISEHFSDDYHTVTIALRSGEPQRVKQYLNSKEYTFNVINDPSGDISRTWGIAVTPTIFIIKNGEITSMTTGFTSPFGMWLRLLMA